MFFKLTHSRELHKKLNAFKTCALQGFGVNYTPTGNYATYQDGTMVAYDISMNFTEIAHWMNEQGHKTSTGKVFRSGHVHSILKIYRIRKPARQHAERINENKSRQRRL